MMVQAMFIYYGSAYLFNINMSMWFAAFFVVSINTGAYMAETVRGGILSVDEGQTEAAKAIGMTHVQTMMNVILPQALRNIMPQIGKQPDHQYQGYLRSFHYWNCRTFLHNKRRSRSLLHLLRILYHRYGNVLYPYLLYAPDCSACWNTRWKARRIMTLQQRIHWLTQVVCIPTLRKGGRNDHE